MRFNVSKETEQFIEIACHALGARTKAVVARAGLFLALGRGVPDAFAPPPLRGVAMSDEQVLGDDLAPLVRAVINYRLGKLASDEEYSKEFRRYLEYGCMLLRESWSDCEKDPVDFLHQLLSDIDLAVGPESIIDVGPESVHFVTREIRLKIAEGEESWSLNGPNVSNGLLLISGRPGAGKSQLALDLLAQLAEHDVPFLFLDMKGELSEESELRRVFLSATKARHIQLVKESLPINPLLAAPNNRERARDANAVADIVKAFAPQFGALQVQQLVRAYQQIDTPDIYTLREAMSREDGGGVGLATISRIADLGLFAHADHALHPSRWLDQPLVVDFSELHDNTTKAITVALVLNYLLATMATVQHPVNGIQPIRIVVFVDEAHLLLPQEPKIRLLGSLARQGRAWGIPLWLASQDADGFVSSGDNGTDFAELADCAVHFSPGTVPRSLRQRLFGVQSWPELKKGDALVRFGNTPATRKSVRQFFQRLRES